ncbi:glutamyl-tRNA(Gln) amidotransferase subunit B, mitochondrial isoform X2 [Lingula anatina]|uniref:Glutamyl-tRNA(Gln) amidotransferase subunit B, mitochondrial n=1 Tax=Lingula anatina TaxID=7574 RepID=A0A1S3K3G5_LINAN|nr:glutamyl-tRNA(Gln) amidotransferase subunit B, mitochondrial isoform X2 [Lingula anatina]|eukprot:XP_013417165.1 glutamyl-tRNA(Gln) amidotransferase subunit B, mitochondrial isoform X2 [Lingula anatina]
MSHTLGRYRRFTSNFQCSYSVYRALTRALHHGQRLSQNARAGWETVVGLEIHAQIASHSKLFSGAGTQFAAPVNNQVSFLDAALPGTLPVLNRRCAEIGVMTGLALGCHINRESRFDRKHYFYADLPQGYQITQQRQPLAEKGEIPYYFFVANDMKSPTKLSARIHHIQLEQDSGKSLQDPEQNMSLIDLNRAGMALMEIVTEPDFRSGEEAAAFVKELQLILTTIGACSGVMAEGAMRVDATVSVNKVGEPISTGVRVEIKNVNSIRGVAKAIEYEFSRHISLLEKGEKIANETRAFDAENVETISMRDKEKVHDYRFMPEPNLPPLRIYDNQTLSSDLSPDQVINVDEIRSSMAATPEERRLALQAKYGLSLEHCQTSEGTEDFFTAVMNADTTRDIAIVYQLLFSILLSFTNEHKIPVDKSPVDIVKFGDTVDLLCSKRITYQVARNIFHQYFEAADNRPVEQMVDEEDWWIITDKTLIEEHCKKLMAESPKKVKNHKKGYRECGFHKAIVVRTQGRADPVLARQVVEENMGKFVKKK